MKSETERLKEIFAEALRRPLAADREHFLAVACQGDAGLRLQVDSLLRAHEQAGDFLAQTIQLPSSDVEPESIGTTIGRYKLLEKIGEGGFGVVYMAEQQEPVQRKVALKIIKAGMDTREVIARFEAERQALALMDHPNIAKVLDGGATEAKRPYFVMELVRGIPITDYCDQARLSTVERLQLFIKVCQAVQHAHQKAVIHRDLKPSNILVTLHDGEPVPKVIDFGVAKALGQKLTDKTLFTSFRQMIGTPAYMAPEQAEMSGLDIDTRSDIYSLGVLLYELLTGVTPFDKETLAKAALDEIRRMIRETDPPKPSTRLQTLGEKLTDVARHRHCEPAALGRLVRGELDWIVMKCLEKDRSRRYDTANALATDLSRHLSDEPVTAGPPSKVYVLQKMVRRNRLAFVAVGAVAAALMLGLGISTWLFLKERKAWQRAVTAESTERQLRQEAIVRAKEARLNQMKTLGDASWAKGNREEAEAAYREALALEKELVGEEQPEVASLTDKLAQTLWGIKGNEAEARSLWRQALALRRRLLGNEHPDVAASLEKLAESFLQPQDFAEAEALHREALAIRRKVLGSEHPDVNRSLRLLARLLQMQGSHAQAEETCREALSMNSKDNPHGRLEALDLLAEILESQGKLPEAEATYRESVETARKIMGTGNPYSAGMLDRLARVLLQEHKFPEAERLFREAVEIQRGFGTGSDAGAGSDAGVSITGLAMVLRDQNKLTESEALFREALAISRKTWPRAPWSSQTEVDNLVNVLRQEGKLEEAEQLFTEMLAPDTVVQPASTWLLRDSSEFFARRGKWQQAVTNASKAMEFQPTNHVAYHMLAPLLVAAGNIASYQQICQKILAQFRGTTNAFIADRMAKDCLILPSAGVDLDLVCQLAETAVTAGKSEKALAYFQCTKALAEYRQGRFSNAVEWARRSTENPSFPADPNRFVEADMVSAMANYKLRQPKEVRAAMVRGAEKAERLVSLESGDLGDGWRDWIIAHALMKEAKALIEGETAAPLQRSDAK